MWGVFYSDEVTPAGDRAPFAAFGDAETAAAYARDVVATHPLVAVVVLPYAARLELWDSFDAPEWARMEELLSGPS